MLDEIVIYRITIDFCNCRQKISGFWYYPWAKTHSLASYSRSTKIAINFRGREKITVLVLQFGKYTFRQMKIGQTIRQRNLMSYLISSFTGSYTRTRSLRRVFCTAKVSILVYRLLIVGIGTFPMRQYEHDKGWWMRSTFTEFFSALQSAPDDWFPQPGKDCDFSATGWQIHWLANMDCDRR